MAYGITQIGGLGAGGSSADDRSSKRAEEKRKRDRKSAENMLYGGLGQVDTDAVSAMEDYLAFAKKKGPQLPNNLENYLKSTYSPYDFQTPDYKETAFASGYAGAAPDLTAAEDITAIDDLPEGVKEAIYETGRQRVGRVATGQREDIADRILRSGGRGGMGGSLRDINRAEMEQSGELAVQSAIADAMRKYQEAGNVRGLRLGREETLAQMLEDQARYMADQNLTTQQLQAGEEKYKTGLADTTATRAAAEAEKKYSYDYGKDQDIINTIMNQAQYGQGQRQDESSNRQAAIQAKLNYLNQGGVYRLNAAQLENKSDQDYAILAGGLGEGVGGIGGNYMSRTQPGNTQYRPMQRTPMKYGVRRSPQQPDNQYQY